MKKIDQKEILILILCLIVGFALRFYTFDQKSLWIDEIHTFNDSRDDIPNQLKYYKENPTYLHPPLFFILTHSFYPFTKPERDLRIIPLIFGILSIPMIYFLSRQFSPNIAIPCTLSLTFMTYHIYFSQDGRMYSLIMFLGMVSLYFFIKHLKTLKKRYLVFVAILYAILFHTSYNSIIFIVLSQMLWFFRINSEQKKSTIPSFFILTGLTLFLCIPWILFIVLNYKGQPVMDPFHTETPGAFRDIIYWIFNDWAPQAPLMISSVLLLILFPLFSNNKKNAFVFLIIFILPIGGLYLFCNLLKITHFFTSRYFIHFLPLFLIALYLSLDAIEMKFERLKKFMRLRFLFTTLFIVSNIFILAYYYQSEKQDFRGLATYLKNQVQNGDKIFVGIRAYMPGILHYFGIAPQKRHYVILFQEDAEKKVECRISFNIQNKIITVYNSQECCSRYIADGSRLWIIVSKEAAKKIKENSRCVLKGYFDGSFANFRKFPMDASMYLFLWDPHSPDEKGIDMPIE